MLGVLKSRTTTSPYLLNEARVHQRSLDPIRLDELAVGKLVLILDSAGDPQLLGLGVQIA